MFVKFDVFFTKNLGTLYKDNSITTLGREAILDLNFDEIVNIHINYKVNNNSFTDLVEIIDVSKRTVRIPFKTDVIKEGIHEFELVATMKNGDVLPSQTYTYKVDKSLENPNAVEADTNYPILIELMDLAGNRLIDMDKSIQKVDTSIENMTNEISSFKEATTNALNSDISNYKEATTNELEESFNNYSNNTTSNITRVLDHKIVEVDNIVSAKSNELDVKFTTKANEITKTLNDEINKVDNTLTNKLNEVNRVLDNKINEVDELIVEVENAEQLRQEELENITNQLSSYSSDLNTVKSNINEHNTRLNALEKGVINDSKIDNLEAKVENHETRIKANENTLKHHDILLKSLNILDETISIENEEGTVISLPQSKDGTITIDELQGNTLVNYCTNGSEELTLNNEINVQGTNVILTDTVDNSKVDVVCEGNTLILDAEGNEVEAGTEGARLVSVGELEDNKIEILSRNKNLFTNINAEYTKILKEDGSYTIIDISDGTELTDFIKVKPNTTYIFSGTQMSSSANVKRISLFDTNKNFIKQPLTVSNTITNFSYTFTTDNNTMYIRLSHYKTDTNVQIEEGNIATSYTERMLNKKEIQLSEPLRGLQNGVCDKFVKQGGKWYVERNCGFSILDGSENVIKWGKNGCFFIQNNFNGLYTDNNSNSLCISDKIPSSNVNFLYAGTSTGISCINDSFIINLGKETVEEVREWLQDNLTKVVYRLATPTYEEITDPQVITYLDTTHISTNSTIPCNMQVKNSEYNAIIKPSTQYTVAFDTNKSGEVNIGLGGAITTTTNNVATITTPSALTDDTLRLYGKDIKASNVRLLEGDKTNYIPSYFEGMKSCFEDKEQDNGSYKMEILSRNENLFVQEGFGYDKDNNGTIVTGGTYDGFVYSNLISTENNKTFYFKNLTEGINGINRNARVLEFGSDKKVLGNSMKLNMSQYTVASGCSYIRVFFDLRDSSGNNPSQLLSLKPMVSTQVITDYVKPMQNKIQLSSLEPLRAVGDVKDRFVLKDGKLMIERNCGIREYQEGDLELDNALTDKINTVYVLNEPTYEEVPYETQKLILECFENGTLFIDTNIPPTVSVTYSANKPVVAKLNQVNDTTNINTEDIAITQMAVDFLLMSSLGEEVINFKVKGGTNMSAYFSSRIIKGALKYEDVIRKYPQYKEDIDLILIAEGYSDLIVEL